MKMNISTNLLVCVLCSALCVLLHTGCATLPKESDILATVDGEPLSREDLAYSIQIAHRRENLSTAHALDINDYLQKLINEKLIIQEARRAGVQDYTEVKKKVNAFLIRESVVRLYNEEIEQKVTVGEEAVAEYYREKYEKFTMGIIEVGSEKEAASILKQLKGGADFKGLAMQYSTHSSKKDGGAVVFVRKDMGPFWEEAVTSLKLGEVGNVQKSGDKYYLIKLINREAAPAKDMESHKEGIGAQLKKRLVQERSDEYLKYLRGQVSPAVHSELLSVIRFSTPQEKEKWLTDGRPLVELKDSVCTVGEFVSALSSDDDKTKEAVLNQWIDKKAVDYEALGRHYEINTDLKDAVRRYEDQLIKNTFIANVIVPQIKISDSEIKEYYEKHQEEFIKPVQYKIQQITLNTREEAQAALDSLREGANFSWLAKEKSVDSVAQSGGNAGWVIKDKLPDSIRASIDNMKPGDISDVLALDTLYRIIRLQEISEKAFEGLEEVRPSIHMKLFREKYDKVFGAYADKLKKDAEIKIYGEAVQSFEKVLGGKSGNENKN